MKRPHCTQVAEFVNCSLFGSWQYCTCVNKSQNDKEFELKISRTKMSELSLADREGLEEGIGIHAVSLVREFK